MKGHPVLSRVSTPAQMQHALSKTTFNAVENTHFRAQVRVQYVTGILGRRASFGIHLKRVAVNSSLHSVLSDK